MTKLKAGFLTMVALFGFGLYLMSNVDDAERRNVTLTITQKQLRQEKGIQVLITYKSSDSEWRGPVVHKSLDPWNKTVSVRVGATVSLNANQLIANELTCIISVATTGEWSKPSTRRSIGSVNCALFIV